MSQSGTRAEQSPASTSTSTSVVVRGGGGSSSSGVDFRELLNTQFQVYMIRAHEDAENSIVDELQLSYVPCNTAHSIARACVLGACLVH